MLKKANLFRAKRAALALALGWTALMGSPTIVQAAEDDHGHEAEHAAESGPNGGALTSEDGAGVELLLSEERGEPRLKIWGYRDGKATPVDAASVSAQVRRPNGEVEALTFRKEAGGLVSVQTIAEPHFLEIEAEVEMGDPARTIHALLEKDEGKITLSPEQVATAGLKLATAGNQAMATTAQFPGEVKFNADRTAHVVPRMEGVVESVSADLGQQVKKGDLLATITSASLSELRSEWLAATKRRDLAAQMHAREQRLWREKVSAEQDYQVARAAFQEAEIAVQNAAQKLRAVGAKPQSNELALLEIRAPFDGVVVEKHIALGEAIAADASIFTISDLRTVWAEFLIAPKDLQAVRVGEDAIVSSTAFDAKAQGKVSYIGSLLGQQTRTATARVTVDNPDASWRPGLFVTVQVVTDDSQVAVGIDADAVHTVDGQSVVFIEVPGGFIAQPITVGKSSNATTEVVKGLAAGTRYVVENGFVLKSELGKASADHAH
ncbi:MULTISPECIES: efflux RND transporter periplasmic adaptor subunit [Achromobacter]|uniref:efflux RND transporter periplasmic adaptor subunit n=1 Tax=Achromobacter TaxID=222 RepID=UPI0024470BAC|nr:efflux RND transporter periplasmic adaptor subunit [Achromobacter animicus]MDH0684826.1 efflux RND transporter periplasmic adaptor subunit [Achromobacter animicus]